jgi:hypothetical protein
LLKIQTTVRDGAIGSVGRRRGAMGAPELVTDEHQLSTLSEV